MQARRQDPTAGGAEPPVAERTRTVLHRSGSVTVRAIGVACREVGLHAAAADGSPLLVVAAGDPLAVAVRGAAHDRPDLPAVVEAVDRCPVPGPEPVRARVWLGGWLSEVPAAERVAAVVAIAERRPAGDLLDVGTTRALLRLEVGQVVLGAGSQASGWPWDGVEVDPDDYAAAAPDVLAEQEAAHLTHLLMAHPQELGLLCGVLDAELRRDARAVVPVRLDRYGLDLHVETRAGAHQVRIAFPVPISRPDQLPSAMQALLAAAACCRSEPPPP